MASRHFLVLLFSVATFGIATAQDPNYILSASSAEGPMGSSHDISITVDNTTGGDLQGWSYGACTDPTHASVTDVVPGSTAAGFDAGGGADFQEVNIFPDGWTVGLVISFVGTEILPPGSGYESDVATVNLLGAIGSTSTIDFCSILGEPPVATVVVVMGASIPPTLSSGMLTVTDPPQFTYTAPDLVGGSPLDVSVSAEDVFGEIGETQGFSMALTNDPALVTVTGIAPAGPLSTVDLDFFEGGLFPDGWTVGVVYSFVGDFTIPFAGATDVVTATYDFTGLPDGESTTLIWSNDLGMPPVSNVVVVNGLSLPATFFDGSITSAPDPQFIRGDCNDDGIVDIADGIWIISELFFLGPVSTCAESCDVNGDDLFDLSDAVYVWNYRFLGGPPPPAPFADCGQVVGAPCESFNSCP